MTNSLTFWEPNSIYICIEGLITQIKALSEDPRNSRSRFSMSMPRREDEAPAPNGLGAKRAKRRCRTGVNNPSCSIVFPMRPYPDVDLIHPSCWLFKPVSCLLGINHEKKKYIYMWASPQKFIEILIFSCSTWCLKFHCKRHDLQVHTSWLPPRLQTYHRLSYIQPPCRANWSQKM